MHTTLTFSKDTVSRAFDERDPATLAGMYTDDAVISVIDQDHPPSAPMVLAGRRRIEEYYKGICAMDVRHHVEHVLTQDSTAAFSMLCSYPDGKKVYCSAMVELEGGRIKRETEVQAWDA